MQHKILALGPLPKAQMTELCATYDVISLWREQDPEACLQQHKDQIKAIVSTAWNPVSGKLMTALPNVALIANFGVGYDNIDLENNDSMEFLQKFTKEYKTDYILSNHQESLNKNYDEIKKFLNVTRDNNNNIIDAFHRTIPLLTKYEKTKIIGIRLKQLNNGAKPYVTISDTILDNNIIVNMELAQKVLPFIVSRPLPNNTYEYWKLQDLELL